MAGLYIHIPFCHSKCSYCDFYSIPGSKQMTSYVDALIKEWDMRKHETDETISTIYLGGGTPSLLPVGELRRLVDELPVDGIKEFTIEANPEDVTDEWATAIASLGINRVSIGIQSFIDDELKAVGRRHSAGDALLALDVLKRNGISNISGDLIYGLPGQTIDSWRYSLETMAGLNLQHISAYSLSFEEGTRLYAQLITGKVREADDDTVAIMYEILTSTLFSFGYKHYEISNFALPGCEAIHNSSYWDFTPYIGLGVSAHSFTGDTRKVNPPVLKRYIDSVLSGQLITEEEHENHTDLYNDYIITRLRTSEGIGLNDLEQRFGKTRRQELEKMTQKYIASGMLVAKHGQIHFSEPAWLISDNILRELIL